MKLILSYLKPYRHTALAGGLIKAFATMLLLLLPYVLELLVDRAAPMRELGKVLFWGFVMILLAFVERLLNRESSRISVKVAKSCIHDLRRDLFARITEFSGGQTDNFGLPSLNARLTSDAYNIQSFYQLSLTFMVRAPILVLGSLLLTLVMDHGLSLILWIITPVMVAAVALVSWKGIPLYGGVQRRVDEATRVLRENITGVRVVRALSREAWEARRFSEVNAALARAERTAGVVMSLPGPTTTLLLNLGLVVIVLIGAQRVNAGLTRPGVILAFLTWFNFILMGVMGLNRIFMMLSKATASADRIAVVLSQPEALPTVSGTTKPADGGYIVFDHVSFGYGKKGEPDAAGFAGGRRELSLSDVSFSVKKGETLGIIGPTGCGKTTVLNLLMRFYDATEGAVFVDGRDVRSYEKDELRRKFGAVFQNDTIFADTLAENISFGRDLAEAAVKDAAADAMAQEFVEAYDDSYAHRAAAHGTDLSGGQRRRVLIARALAADPEILLLDDASSALDYRTDAAVRKAVGEHHGNATIIVVAQRVSSIMDSNEILVMDEGRIIGRGTHETLLQSCPHYREIYETQMGEAV